MIQGTVLVVVVEDVGVVEATLAMTTVVEAGLITLAVVEVDGTQVAVVAPPGELAVLVEDLGVGMLLDGLELVVVTVMVAVAGEQLVVVLTVRVLEVEEGAGELLLVVRMTQDGAAPKRLYQLRMVGTVAGAPEAGDEFVHHTCCEVVHPIR